MIPCQFLADLENDLIHENGEETRLCDYFDLIAGTSTGGIIAIGLALGVKAQDILDLYVNHGNDIFPVAQQRKISKAKRLLLNKPFYDREPLKKLLNKTYNTDREIARMGDARTRLLIPTYNLEAHQIHVLKTAHSEVLERDYQIPAVDAALSTAAAPAYFTPYDFSYDNKGKNGSVQCNMMVDGGLVANNPAFMALLEATHCLDVKLENVGLLSLGTGVARKACPEKSSKVTPLFWVNPLNGPMIYEIMAEAQSVYVDDLLNLYKNGVGQVNSDTFTYFRLQHQFSEKECLDLDSTSTSTIRKMQQAGHVLYKDNCSKIKSIFTTVVKKEFNPHHNFS